MSTQPAAALVLSTSTQERIQALFRRWTRLEIGVDRGPLLVARLAPVVRRAGLLSFDELVARAERGDDTLQTWIVSALTTHVTSFFREAHHFELLERYVGAEPDNRPSRMLRVWSAGCSTGEEAYSAAAVLCQSVSGTSREIEIVGTDIDQMSLDVATRAIYPLAALTQAVPRALRPLFEVGRGSKQGYMRASPALQQVTSFRRMNLLESSPPGDFDTVFCRNVLIYFRGPQIERAIANLAERVRLGGLLLLGHAEGRLAPPGFEAIGPTAYRRIARENRLR